MTLFEARYKTNAFLYKTIAKPILFKFDPELMHDVFTAVGSQLGRYTLTRTIAKSLYNYQSPILEQNLKGIHFRNQFGLSAGFDKNARMMEVMEAIGFGFVEVGSITNLASPGNSGIRLKRIPEKNAIWVNFGLNNDGAVRIKDRLTDTHAHIPIGLSIARTNCKETVDEKVAIKDQVKAFKTLKDQGSYITLNISCPNSYGGQPFSNPRRFEKLMNALSNIDINKPLFVKLSPDLTDQNIYRIIAISKKYKVAGFICSNLTKQKGVASGGYSGKMVEDKANALLSKVYKKTKGNFILIGCGGVFTAEDAYKKIKLGANLVQLATGLIYRGPSLIGELNYELTQLLKKDGHASISEAVGSAYT